MSDRGRKREEGEGLAQPAEVPLFLLQPKFTASEQMERSISVSHNEEEQSNLLVTSLSEKLESLSTISPDCCIYRVPQRLRESNEKAYTPRVVSLGPLHHGSRGLQAMEEHKRRYLKDFVQRSNVSLEDCVKLLKEREARVRNSYEETFDQFKSNEFLEMILVDAVFVIEVMLRSYPSSNLQNTYECDRIFRKPWLITDILFDMVLLENQLPFFILEDLFAMAIPTENKNDVRCYLIKITHYIFEGKAQSGGIEQCLEKLCSSKIEHIVHFLRICHLPQELPRARKLESLSVPSASQLHRAGVKFRVRSTVNLCDIRFQNGILEIPRLEIWSSNEIIFRNLIAFEQCHCSDIYINHYFFVIDRLIDTPSDVELLVRSGIIESKLPDSQGVATFINNLLPGTALSKEYFYFTDLCKHLNTYYENPWHKWKATLKQDYFSTPWAVVSIIVAVVLLVLTLIQTVCSVISL